jgi:hypothetical protein
MSDRNVRIDIDMSWVFIGLVLLAFGFLHFGHGCLGTSWELEPVEVRIIDGDCEVVDER